MAIILPFRPSVGAYTFGAILRNTEYVFDVRWNSHGNGFVDGAWRGAFFFDVRKIDRTPIVIGIKLVLGVYFGRRSADPLFADGAMVARPVNDDRREPTFDDAGTRVQVWYFTRDELVEEITSVLTGGA